MLFNSLEFAFFLGAVLFLYYVAVPARWERARKTVLLVASYFFYASWNPPFALLLLGSTVLDFCLGLAMDATESRARRRLCVVTSLVGNLGVLGFFKYGGFFTEQFYLVAGWMSGTPEPPPIWDIVLPVGISFYTFQTLSYSIDLYRGEQRACRSFLDFALFVSFFPQLVAGPIVRSRDFLPQLEGRPNVTPSDVELAFVRIIAGLVKKVVLADTIGEYVDNVFQYTRSFGTPNLLLAMYAYAYQIYFDFSGYSDMAIGLASLFGFRIPENFDRPYLSKSPREFWQRWHISLSTWLRDYLYISLGGNRRGAVRTYYNLAVTMLLGGLWHGASWNFVVWGAIHGLWLAVHRFVTRGKAVVEDSRTVRILKQIGTFHMVCIAWVFFRAPDFASALLFFQRLLVWEVNVHSTAVIALVGVSISLILHLSEAPLDLRERYRRLPPVVQGIGYAIAFVLVFLFSPQTARFIYFQF
jgi:D-alanyl-lipoteichoic acid acyltransferase DltB (MBOAT superfamily)